jgi:hypothetical protein
MKVLQAVKSEHVVAIDIETVRLRDEFDDLPESYQNAWEYKNKQNGEVPTQEELSDLWKKQASLYAEFSKICAVSISFLDKSGTKLICKGFVSENERELLMDLYSFLNRISSGSPYFRLIGHASNWFDFGFMGKRYVINQLPIPSILDDTDKKPWETLNMDTNNLWKMGKQGTGSSLQALCNVLDVPTSKADMVGDEVGREYFKGNLQGIKNYCNKDSIATFNVFRRFKYEPIFHFDEVVYLEDSNDTSEESEVIGGGVLHKLFTTKEFTDDIKEGIREKLRGKKILKKEWPILEDMVTHLYMNNEMFKSDSDEVKLRKANEVGEFINELKEEHNA